MLNRQFVIFLPLQSPQYAHGVQPRHKHFGDQRIGAHLFQCFQQGQPVTRALLHVMPPGTKDIAQLFSPFPGITGEEDMFHLIHFHSPPKNWISGHNITIFW